MSQPAPESLLLPREKAVISDSPFFFARIDDFLPAEQYRRLLESFPGEDWFPETIEGSKKRLNSRWAAGVFQEFCRAQPAWADLFAQLSNEQFLAGLYDLVRDPLRQVRGMLGARPWRLGDQARTPIDGLLKRRVKVTFEFSRLEKGSIVPPHTDAPEKLVTMILYFADADWQESYGGGTVFYRPRRPALERNWSNYRVPFADLETAAVNQFIPNRLCIFVKSRDSYHGLPAITCPDGMARNSVNINIFRTKPKRLRRIAESRDRWFERMELRRQNG